MVEKEKVDSAHCENCGFRGTPLCTHPSGYYEATDPDLSELIKKIQKKEVPKNGRE